MNTSTTNSITTMKSINSLTLQFFPTKKSLFSLKYLTTLSKLNYPQNFINNPCENHDDPLQIFAESIKSRVVTIKDAYSLHGFLLKWGYLYSELFITNSLIDKYMKFLCFDNARQVFDEMPERNFVTWNVMISGFNCNALYNDSWRLFCRMRVMGVGCNEFTYGGVISACGRLGYVLYGKLVYMLSIKDGFFSNGYVRSGLIDLFSRSGCFKDALQVFNDWPFEVNDVCWNSVISGATKVGDDRMAIELFARMRGVAVIPNSFTFSSVLSACVALEDGDLGRKIHGLVIKHGIGKDLFIGTSITDLYAKHGDMNEATKNFLRMPVHNVVSWTAMISGFVQRDDSISALNLFSQMRKAGVEVNKYTVTSILSACAKSHLIDAALQMHSWSIKSGLCRHSSVVASLINTYTKVGEVGLAELLYLEQEDLKDPNLWTVMISSFAQNRRLGKATELFLEMLHRGLKPDNFAISSILSIIDHVNIGRQVHTYTLKTGLNFDVSVGSSLFTMYSKCGCLPESHQVFLQLPHKDIVSWASMISGFAEHGFANNAIQLFKEMIEMDIRPDQTTLVGVLNACSSFSTPIGKEVHGYAFRVGISSENSISSALINMYCKCGCIDSARRVFNMLFFKDPISCSALISGYAQNGCIEEALSVFGEMLMADIEIDSYTLSSILSSNALLNRTEIGLQLHTLAIKLGLQSDVSVGSSLITMYSKRGAILDCHKSFDEIDKPDLISFTTMILCYAQHGKGEEALKLYNDMKRQGIKPDSVTFVGVLSACTHNGLVEEGYYHLHSMSKKYGIEPGYRHYACMVDLLGRSGRLKEAEEFIYEMPIKPDALIWGTLLAACKVHGNVELGRIAAKKVLDLQPSDPSAYVSLSNIFANMGQWDEVEEIRSLMKGTGLSKEPGWSHA